ncbi:MAG: hypothetical protein NXI30_20590 [bacterium]|nr:hypothetical protein [bacterium]
MATRVAVLMRVASIAEANALRGHGPYLRDCSACHGAEADGQGPVANALTPPPPALTRLRSKYGHPLGTRFVAYVPGTTMPRAQGTSDMPVWGRNLAGEDGSDGEAVGLIWRVANDLQSVQER